MTSTPARRAAPPRPPTLSAAAQRELAQHEQQVAKEVGRERQSLLRGLLILAVLVLIASLIHAGRDRAFYAGWWRQW